MPHLNPFQFLMDAMAQLTGGLISDLQSVLLGVLVCSFIVFGLGYLKDSLDSVFDARMADRYSNEASKAFTDRNKHSRDSFEWEQANLKYRRLLNKAVDQDLKNSRL